MSAYHLLHPGIQRAVFEMGWPSLRPLQEQAIQEVLGGEAPLILAAATASGKTEAAFLPVLSQIASDPADSVQAVYVSPLRALINDQFRRLEDLCKTADIPVHRWHGDVGATERKRLRENPGGVLLITPESLEAHFCHQDSHLARIYAALRFVVIDELHVFLNDVRGMHLMSLLARLGIQAKVRPRLLGLSATLGDFSGARRFLHPDDPDAVKVLQDPPGERDLRISAKAFHTSPQDAGETGEGEDEAESDTERETRPEAIAAPAVTVSTDGLAAVAHDVALRFRNGTNLVFCNRRQDAEVLADKLNQTAKQERWSRNPFIVHHGSLSRELREEAETQLKSGEPTTAFCTGTLEMGIDIGSVKAVGQVDPPWRVASLVQRLGRCGRREGEPQMLRLYTLDRQPVSNADLAARLYPSLVRGIAMVELHLEKWLEPPDRDRRHCSTCIHQVLSILRQTGGASAALLHQRLCEAGPFRRLGKAGFLTLLRGLAAKGIVEQTPPGDLILAPEGERIANSRDFYIAFIGSVDYSVEHGEQRIGLLPAGSIPQPGEHLLLAGRRWRVEEVDSENLRVRVSPAFGWKRLPMQSPPGDIHPRILQMMRTVLEGARLFPYLDNRAASFLQEARAAWQKAELSQRTIVPSGKDVLWFTWQGSAVCTALVLAAQAAGLRASWQGLVVRYEKTAMRTFGNHLRFLLETDLTAAITPCLSLKIMARDRFDPLVDPALLQEAFLEERLDLQRVKALAASALEEISARQESPAGPLPLPPADMPPASSAPPASRVPFSPDISKPDSRPPVPPGSDVGGA